MTGNGSAPDEGIASQRLRLASLESCEERIRALRDKECDLEVEQIAAQAALKSATSRIRPTVDAQLASRLGRSLEHRRELEEQRRKAQAGSGRRRSETVKARDELRAAHAALLAWLDASKASEPGRLAAAAKVTLLVATIATVWAAISIHPAFLLMLVVIVGPVSFALGRGQDAQWRRVGARRRFEACGLPDLAVWDEQNVRARAAELASLLDRAEAVEPEREGEEQPPEHPPDIGELNARIAEEDRRIETELAAAGLTEADTQSELGEWLRLVARADRSRETLERVKGERGRLRAEAAELRSQLVGFLRSREVKAIDEHDSVAAIAERLERLR